VFVLLLLLQFDGIENNIETKNQHVLFELEQDARKMNEHVEHQLIVELFLLCVFQH
jgi:hypothetical protein